MRVVFSIVLFGALTAFSAPVPVATAASAANACGCYRDDAGQCRCAKKGKCDCPGDCEPVGCEEKRQKQLEKEAQAELKRIQEREKKRDAQAQKKQKKEAAKEQ